MNVLWIGGRKCLLLTHAGTLFSAFVADVRVAELRPISAYVVKLIEAELRAEGLLAGCLGPLDVNAVHIAKPVDRSILGVMNDQAVQARSAVAEAGGLSATDVAAVNRLLRRSLSRREGSYASALERVSQRLAAS